MALRNRARAYLRGPEIEPRPATETAIQGPARLGRRTKELVKRLRPGEVAVIDHADLDRIAAEDLVACGVAAVVNVAKSSTGRYPNPGPLVLARAGVRLVDAPAAPLFEELDDGERVTVQDGEVRANGTVLASGRTIDLDEASGVLEQQQSRIDEALRAFAENTIEHAREEVELLTGKIEFPRVRTSFRDRHALIVVRGTTYRRDLRTLRAYIEDTHPVLVGVDGGADAILERALRRTWCSAIWTPPATPRSPAAPRPSSTRIPTAAPRARAPAPARGGAGGRPRGRHQPGRGDAARP